MLAGPRFSDFIIFAFSKYYLLLSLVPPSAQLIWVFPWVDFPHVHWSSAEPLGTIREKANPSFIDLFIMLQLILSDCRSEVRLKLSITNV